MKCHNHRNQMKLSHSKNGKCDLLKAVLFMCYQPLLCYLCSHKTRKMKMSSQGRCIGALTNSTTQLMEWWVHRTGAGDKHLYIYNDKSTIYCFCTRDELRLLMCLAPDGCSCSHGHGWPYHRGYGDHCSLAELDRGFPLTQARGMGIISHKTPIYTPWSQSQAVSEITLYALCNM